MAMHAPHQSLDEDILREDIAALGPWFHNLRLGGVETAPDHFLGGCAEI